MLTYEFLIDNGSGTYVTYTDTHMVFNGALQQVDIQSTDSVLDLVTNKMKVRAAITDSLVTTSAF